MCYASFTLNLALFKPLCLSICKLEILLRHLCDENNVQHIFKAEAHLELGTT